MGKREKKEPAKPSTAWQGTYGDMITLMLCFFVMLYDPSESDAVQMAALAASLSNNNPGGGISVSPGTLADLGKRTYCTLATLINFHAELSANKGAA